MTKVITINSCRECDKSDTQTLCGLGLYCNHLEQKVTDSIHEEDLPPNYIHPDCKLNDLPTVEEIEIYADARSATPEIETQMIDAACHVLNLITAK